jgi:hypothetical protein
VPAAERISGISAGKGKIGRPNWAGLAAVGRWRPLNYDNAKARKQEIGRTHVNFGLSCIRDFVIHVSRERGGSQFTQAWNAPKDSSKLKIVVESGDERNLELISRPSPPTVEE